MLVPDSVTFARRIFLEIGKMSLCLIGEVASIHSVGKHHICKEEIDGNFVHYIARLLGEAETILLVEDDEEGTDSLK